MNEYQISRVWVTVSRVKQLKNDQVGVKHGIKNGRVWVEYANIEVLSHSLLRKSGQDMKSSYL